MDLSPFQIRCLSFLRRRSHLSFAQMFLMWRHTAPGADGGYSAMSAKYVPPEDYQGLPPAPRSTALFSADELVVIDRLLRTTFPDRQRYDGWALVNLFVVERLFPEHLLHPPVAGRLLKEANDADDLVAWVVRQADTGSEAYLRRFDLRAMDVCRLADPQQVDNETFNAVTGKRRSPKP